MRLTKHILLVALALAVLAGAPAALAGKPVGIAESFPTRCNVETVAPAPGGGAWFACTYYFPGANKSIHTTAKAGVITAAGQVTEFPTPAPEESGPGDVSVTASDGSFWFPVRKSFEATSHYVKTVVPASLARVSPTGQVALFPMGAGAVLELAAGPDGSVLMKVAEGPEQKTVVVLQVAPTGAMTPTAVDPALPLGETATFPRQPVAPSGTIYTGRALGADGNLWFGIQAGSGAIGRLTPSGETTEFHDCLSYSQPYFGPEDLVRGTEGNIWFTSLAERSLPNIVDPASIGMVTPAGAITQLYAGVKVEPKTIAPDSEGGVWFAGGLEEVQRIKPPVGVVNTFHIGKLSAVKRGGSALLKVKVPGPGTIRAKPVAILIGGRKNGKRIAIHAAGGATATNVCGSPRVRVHLVGEALRRLRGRGEVRVATTVTFTPRGGQAYTEEKTLRFQIPTHR